MIDPEAYQAQVANTVIAAIIDLYPDGTGQGGTIDPLGAINGLAIAMAMIATNTGAYSTPAKRRELADKVRRNLLIALGNATAAKESGAMDEWLKAVPLPRGRH